MLGAVHTNSGSRSDSQTLSDQRLYAALKQIDRGVMSPSTRGSMHGEIGQTQFLPKNILAYGTGNLDVAANALNSTANFLKAMAGVPARDTNRAKPISQRSRRGCRSNLSARHRAYRPAD
jgi:membrane-bound lytic murein transglycosylase B